MSVQVKVVIAAAKLTRGKQTETLKEVLDILEEANLPTESSSDWRFDKSFHIFTEPSFFDIRVEGGASSKVINKEWCEKITGAISRLNPGAMSSVGVWNLDAPPHAFSNAGINVGE